MADRGTAMLVRGKFCSLTLINWNGFFARTFDLDNLVTTLSGGNGAGKSTTMAAFITALIPDLTLLHFRNTTEAGTTLGSRDKGLYGKLRPGNCYAVVEVINAQQQRLLFGVRLQQISGREGKIDLKPFLLQDWSENILALFTEKLPEKAEVRIRPLSAIKSWLAAQKSTVYFKVFNSITDYHAVLFDRGVIPKRLVAAADRQKFYRLIEASLYGGISSAITRSLRDYLLPDNGGVRKAFQDMEAALRENRLTLAAIRHTQADRDLFKQLMLHVTHYVAADYMRQRNQRREQVQQQLTDRHALQGFQQQCEQQQQQISQWQRQLLDQQKQKSEWQQQYQQAQQAYQQAQWAALQQVKIARCQEEELALQEKLTAQQQQLIEADQQLAQADQQVERCNEQLDSLRNQLADQQQALDQQQVRAVRYRQAMQALEQARTVCQQPELQPGDAPQHQKSVEQALQAATEQLLIVSQQLSVAKAAAQQFSTACQQISRLVGKVSIEPTEAYEQTGRLLKQLSDQQRLADTLPWLQQQQVEAEQRLLQQQQAENLWQRFCQQQSLPSKTLPNQQQLLQQRQQQQQIQQQLVEQLSLQSVEHAEIEQQIRQLTQQQQHQQQRAPTWLAAQQALQALSQQCQQPLTDSQAISDQLQRLRQSQQQWLRQQADLQAQQQALSQQITVLQQPGGVEESELNTLAEALGGSLLSEIYEEISLEEAPYYSALYGPARQAIVVADLAKAQQRLLALECPVEDLYLIEGDPQAFNEQLFEAHCYANGVMVQLTDRQWRYSCLPEMPLFGRRAREQRLEALRLQQKTVEADYREIAGVVQRGERLQQAFNQFISDHLAIAFTEDPELSLKQGQQQLQALEQQQRQLKQRQTQLQQQQQQLQQAQEQLEPLLPLVPLLLDQNISEQVSTVKQSVVAARQAKQWVEQNAKSIQRLSEQLPNLQQLPQPPSRLQAAYQQQEQQQRQLQRQRFALAEVIQRADHFIDIPVEAGDQDLQGLNQQLRQHLATVEASRQQAQKQQQQAQQQQRQWQAALAALTSTLEIKQQWRQELQQELADLSPQDGPETLTQTEQRCQSLQQAIEVNQQHRQQLAKRLACSEQTLSQLQVNCQQQQQQQRQQRQQLVAAKKRWSQVQQFVRTNHLASALQQSGFAYQSADELRSISDRALGALRQAVADNDSLRDALRASEGASALLKKLEFYQKVYQHLQQRIRQDILRTDDPLLAIEQMEVELARLTEELTLRESHLTLSTKGVASIIHKTIQREQSRIQLLNQGLQQVTFGQVRGVRLVVTVHDSHQRLLNALVDPQAPYQDLFSNRQLAFSEALATLYRQLTPQAFSQQSMVTLGETLLDYRYYLDLKVEIFRDSEGWLRAESGTLSTGEAIGTGMAILMMVVQSWEEESARLRGKDNQPCRLLFLDEAARLDSQSISTLFELCDRLQTQLLIAAPENIHPEQGTTYKLVRKLFQQREQVQVVGLRGFASETPSSIAVVG